MRGIIKHEDWTVADQAASFLRIDRDEERTGALQKGLRPIVIRGKH
jgi:hypothetical protein